MPKIWIKIYYLLLFKISFIFAEIEKGRLCQNDSDCNLPNSYCLDGKMCSCKPKFLEISTSKTTFICLNKAIDFGDPCLYDVQCTATFGLHAECKGAIISTKILGKCDCYGDAHYQDGICYKNSRIGEQCQVNDNCVISTPDLVAYCDKSRCVCPPNYHPNNNGTDCLPNSVLGGPCLTEEDCVTINSKCSEVCTCKVDYVVNSDGNHCLLAANQLDAPCEEDRQCTEYLPRTICHRNDKRCTCNPNSHEINGVCYKSAGLHEPCNQKKECLIKSKNITRVDCYKGFCICSNGFEMVNRTDCIYSTSALTGSSTLAAYFSNNLLLLYLIAIICQFF